MLIVVLCLVLVQARLFLRAPGSVVLLGSPGSRWTGPSASGCFAAPAPCARRPRHCSGVFESGLAEYSSDRLRSPRRSGRAVSPAQPSWRRRHGRLGDGDSLEGAKRLRPHPLAYPPPPRQLDIPDSMRVPAPCRRIRNPTTAVSRPDEDLLRLPGAERERRALWCSKRSKRLPPPATPPGLKREAHVRTPNGRRRPTDRDAGAARSRMDKRLAATGLEPATSGVTGGARGPKILHATTRKSQISRDFLQTAKSRCTTFHGASGASRPIQAPSRCRLC
jgi:hypothetical protein